MRKHRKYRDAAIEALKDNPEDAHAYLQVALEDFEQDRNTEALLTALRTVAEAQGGIPELARRTNMEKMTLYKALSEKGNPKLSTIGAILHGLGYKLTVTPYTAQEKFSDENLDLVSTA
jgi:probable addiction module antidote protein